MTRPIPRSGAWYWERFVGPDGSWRQPRGGPPGEDLAALRRGANGEAGAVASMWPFHVVVVPEERLQPRADTWSEPPELAAEHHALVLYAHHQQSQGTPVHRHGIGLGHALRKLHRRYSEKAVDRRFFATVTADEVDELAYHLRGLIGQLRSLQPTAAFDYSWLVEDLYKWHQPERRHAVRRRWGLDYYASPTDVPLTPGGERPTQRPTIDQREETSKQ